MNKKIEHCLLNQITNNISVLIIENEKILENKFGEYFNNIFKTIKYLSTEDKILNYYNNEQVDIIYIDLQILNIQPFKLIDEIKIINPRQQIIAISQTDCKDILKRCIHSNISNFLQKPIKITKLKDSIINSIESIILENKVETIKTEIATDIKIEPKKAIEYLMENYHIDIELVNQYKGIPIIRDASILDIIGDEIIVRIEDVQKYALEYSHHSVISSPYLSDDIYTNLKQIDTNKNIAVFNKFSFVNSYMHHRLSTRVVPDGYFSMVFKINGIIHNCNILDISENYALIYLKDIEKNFEINSQILFQISLKIESQFSKNSFTSHTIKTKCTIQDIFPFEEGNKALIYFEFNEEDKRQFDKYVEQRGFRLIKEFKTSCIKH